jgi:AraC-like DNA-binding protein
MNLSHDIYRRVVAAKMYMDENLHEALDLEQISRQACISRFHFHRIFSGIYRKTPHQYLTSARLNMARSLLQKENITITEVCASVGFDSLGSFSNLFKKDTGATPHSYRDLIYRKKKEAQQQPRKFIPHCFIEQYLKG